MARSIGHVTIAAVTIFLHRHQAHRQPARIRRMRGIHQRLDLHHQRTRAFQCRQYAGAGNVLRVLREVKPDFLVNCAGYTGKPNVDACEKHQADTLLGNVSLPQTLAQAWEVANVPWGHVSSGCIYAGAKIVQPDGSLVFEAGPGGASERGPPVSTSAGATTKRSWWFSRSSAKPDEYP